MGATENLLVGRDSRGMKAWGLALAVAVVLTQALDSAGLVHLTASIYAAPQLDWLSTLAGGVLFGLGMALAGTCSFGLLVRAGSGDMRALLLALVVGIFAFATIAGPLSWVRTRIGGLGVLDLPDPHGALLTATLSQSFGQIFAVAAVAGVALTLALTALLDKRLWSRPRLLLSAFALGLAIAGGWLATSHSLITMEGLRAESLSFVAPVGRMLVEFMGGSAQGAEFGAGTVLGVFGGSLCVGWLRDELHWEAFDDVVEMRRHILGAALMGTGGVLAKGCTIGQGMSAASALAMSAPIAVAGFLIGARLGLHVLLDAHPENSR